MDFYNPLASVLDWARERDESISKIFTNLYEQWKEETSCSVHLGHWEGKLRG